MQEQPRIRQWRVRTVRVPLAEPHNTASGTVAESPLVLTDVACDDGGVGHSIVFTYTPAALKPTADLVATFGSWFVGETSAPLEIENRIARRLRLLGPQGLTGMAAAAIDMALWDAAARRHGVSLAALLGASPRQVPAYGAVGYDGIDGSARTAEQWAKRGFTGVKAKIGYPSIAEDLAVVRAMRSAIGRDVAILVDYNQSLTPTEAIERVRALDAEGLVWVEEPTLAHDYAGHARIAQAAATPIQCGENWWGVLDLRHALDAGASDFVMPDVMKIGGVSGWMRASALASARNVRVSNHLWPEISAQLLSATPTAHWLEYADWWNPVMAEPLVIEKGMANCAGVMGSGVAWNESAIEKFAA
ncbi:MAG TPA: enolase C-terminal domain-like protein [Burkholderiaceae bacterium]|nr:enolase C-terminal domain-like protein [Burkholderiaceae bacterium]